MNDTKEKETEQTKTGGWPEVKGVGDDTDDDNDQENDRESSDRDKG